MKKFLLLAVAALVAGSASAQFSPKTSVSKAETRLERPAMKSSKKEIAPVAVAKPGQLVKAGVPAKAQVMKSAQMKASTKATAKVNAQVIRKAGEVQAEYTGTGKVYDFDASAYVSVDPWTMYAGEDEIGTTYLADVIPNPFNGLEAVYVEYTLEDNVIRIEPQEIVYYTGDDDNVYHVFIDGYTDDSAIEMTLEEDGSITIDRSLAIYYDVFTTDEFDPSFTRVADGGTYLGAYTIASSLKYLLPGQIAAPAVEYSPEGLYLHMAYSHSGYGYNNNLALLPADSPVRLINDTEDIADTWSWRFPALEYNDLIEEYIETDDVQLGSERDFTAYTTVGAVYSPAELKGAFQGAESDPYIWGQMNESELAFAYAGGQGSDFEFTDGTLSMATRANPDFSIAYHPYLATPDVNAGGYTMNSMIFYQGKPSAPLYFEGVNMYVRDFEAHEGLDVKCKLQKVTRDANGRIAFGDVIAQADLDIENVATDWCTELVWKDFYVEDELGMSETLDYLQIEDEFAIIIDGWDNGTFTATPYVEYYGNENGKPNVYFGMDESIYSFTSSSFKGYVGFVNAVYGYLHTDDETDLHFEKAGGEATIHVQPMFYNGSDAEQQTALWLQEGCEIPEWLEVGIDNEVYSQEDFGFDLVVKAAELTDAEYREAELVFEQWGSKLVVNVTQGEKAPVITINVEREVGLGYDPTSYEPDFTEALAYLGIEKETDATLVGINADGSEVAAPGPGGIDGWCDADGNFIGWGQENTRICVKFFPSVSQYEICDMNGADEVGAEYTVKYGLKANGKMATFAITVKFIEQQSVNIAISETIIKGRVAYETTEPSYVEKIVTLSDDDISSILFELGLESLDEATVYGFNPTTDEVLKSFGGYDGWRDANGDFAYHTGNSTVPACVKYTDGKNYYCYNVAGCDPMEVKCYWLIANNIRGIRVEITFAYEIPESITEVNADEQAGAIYNINGVRVQNAKQKGVYIQNGKKVVVK